MARTKEFDIDEKVGKAIDLFWQKGYEACSMQDIVDGLGISRSSLYDTFGDKRQLYIAALVKYQEVALLNMRQLLEGSSDYKQFIHTLFDRAIKEIEEDDLNRGCFLVNAATELAAADEEIGALVQTNMLAVQDILFEAVQEGQASGQIRSEHEPRSLARFIFNNFSGLRVAAKSGVDKKALDDIVGVALSVL